MWPFFFLLRSGSLSHIPDQRTRTTHWSAPRRTPPIPRGRLNPIGGSKYSGPAYQHLQEVDSSDREAEAQRGWGEDENECIFVINKRLPTSDRLTTTQCRKNSQRARRQSMSSCCQTIRHTVSYLCCVLVCCRSWDHHHDDSGKNSVDAYFENEGWFHRLFTHAKARTSHV